MAHNSLDRCRARHTTLFEWKFESIRSPSRSIYVARMNARAVKLRPDVVITLRLLHAVQAKRPAPFQIEVGPVTRMVALGFLSMRRLLQQVESSPEPGQCAGDLQQAHDGQISRCEQSVRRRPARSSGPVARRIELHSGSSLRMARPSRQRGHRQTLTGNDHYSDRFHWAAHDRAEPEAGAGGIGRSLSANRRGFPLLLPTADHIFVLASSRLNFEGAHVELGKGTTVACNSDRGGLNSHLLIAFSSQQ